MSEPTPEVVTDALRSIATNQPPSIRPERAPNPMPRKSSAEIQAEIREQKQRELSATDIAQTVKTGWKSSEFWVAILGGVFGSLAVARGWISESALADLTQNLGAPYILGRSFGPKLLTILAERLKK